MKRFKQLIKEFPNKKVVFAFGRFQPPTIGHELLIKAVKKIAGSSSDYVIYASKTEDKKTNPLSVDRKLYFLNRIFPNTNFKAADNTVRTFLEAAKQLNKKYKNIIMVAGSDRVSEFENVLNKYNGKEYNFDTIEVVSAGARDPDSDSASGMSGTKMRVAAKEGNFKDFKMGLPQTLTILDSKRLMNDIRKGMNLEIVKESFEFERIEIREQYISGKIFNIGDKVEDAQGIYEIMDRGSNYITVVNESGNLSKKFLDKVTPVKVLIEDIGVYCPKEISFKGYTTKNLHNAPDASEAFLDSIQRVGNKDPISILNAVKATDIYMGLCAEKDKSFTVEELSLWKSAHDKARNSLERVDEFTHHMDYWNNQGKKLLTGLNKTRGIENDYNESLSKLEDDMLKEELKFAAVDRIKVARIIAVTFGVENADRASSPEQLVNAGLRKIRNKTFTPDMALVIHNMLDTARTANIKFDEKLLPVKVAAIDVVKEDAVNTKTNYNFANSILTYKDYLRLKKEQEDAAEEEEENAEGEAAEADEDETNGKISNASIKKHDLMHAPIQSNNSRKQKIAYHLGEMTDAEMKKLENLTSFKNKMKNSYSSYNSKDHTKEVQPVNKKIAKEEVELEEGSFKYHMDKAIAAHDRNDTKNKEYHLGNAKTARYALPSNEYAKHKDLFAKYKQMTEEVDLDESNEDFLHARIKSEYDSLKKQPFSYVKSLIKLQHKIVDVSGYENKEHAISSYLNDKHGHKRVSAALNSLKEVDSKKKSEISDIAAPAVWNDSQFSGVIGSDSDTDLEQLELTDTEIDQLIAPIEDIEDIIDDYEEDEYYLKDTDTGEEYEEDEKVNESSLMEVLSRAERIKQKIRFAQSSSKRKRSLKIALRMHSSAAKINKRARVAAVKLLKMRILKKPLNTLSIAEKERIEKILQTKKKLIARIASKLTSRIRKIENDRLSR